MDATGEAEELARVVTIAELVEEIKNQYCKMDQTKGQVFRNFNWQKGYGAFSVGRTGIDTVKQYINNQKQHHRRVTFQEEYREFLKEGGVPYDERYLWD